jgi:hypothetical protein
MNCFATTKGKLKFGGWNLNDLTAYAFEMHFDAGLARVPAGTMAKAGKIEVRTEFVVEATQDVQLNAAVTPWLSS